MFRTFAKPRMQQKAGGRPFSEVDFQVRMGHSACEGPAGRRVARKSSTGQLRRARNACWGCHDGSKAADKLDFLIANVKFRVDSVNPPIRIETAVNPYVSFA